MGFLLAPSLLAISSGGGLASVVAGTAATAGTGMGIGSMLSLGGTLFSAFGQMSSGKAASDAAKYNAQVQMNNAKIAERNASFAGAAGEAKAGVEGAKTKAVVGAIKAQQAASGIKVNQGSAVDVRSSAAELGQLNTINIRADAARQAYGYQVDAATDRAQAGLDLANAKASTTAGYIGAGSTLLGGIGDSYNAHLRSGSLS